MALVQIGHRSKIKGKLNKPKWIRLIVPVTYIHELVLPSFVLINGKSAVEVEYLDLFCGLCQKQLLEAAYPVTELSVSYKAKRLRLGR